MNGKPRTAESPMRRYRGKSDSLQGASYRLVRSRKATGANLPIAIASLIRTI
ncbi:hypothetical protein [Coleofasciculus sp. FACHB-1120]|uniref:hypothetical protein n=1 Tax=Coleofasciculus sp. FACHB-1120 TaxID=2692783 RepID=UPI001684ED1F|nr:hypothetical protein [Coleofasciculus sp. FACHB-1120]MBD2740757.1 hypothetical protein [Coleofasciculus sp. FACHB-1120]